jgi:hypothetical protein
VRAAPNIEKIPMIDTALSLVSEQLNRHLRATMNASEDLVVLSNLIDVDGTVRPHTNNRVAVFLAQIQTVRIDTRPRQPAGEGAVVHARALDLTLRVVFAANFQSYPESLKLIGLTLAFVHSLPIIDNDGARLALSIETLNAQELSELWKTAGCGYVPSIVCKLAASYVLG